MVVLLRSPFDSRRLNVRRLFRTFALTRGRPQFSLAALLAMTAAAAFAAHCYAEWSRFQSAQHDFIAAKAFYEAGMVATEDFASASRKLLDAELAIPFRRSRTAKLGYLKRTAWLERLLAGRCFMPGSREAMEEHEGKVLQLRAERERLEAELGVKADEEL